VYAFIVGFNKWMLKSFVREMEWRRTKSRDASGWEHEAQVICELKTLQALTGMHRRNRKLIVVKPAKGAGYMPSRLMTDGRRPSAAASRSKNS